MLCSPAFFVHPTRGHTFSWAAPHEMCMPTLESLAVKACPYRSPMLQATLRYFTIRWREQDKYEGTRGRLAIRAANAAGNVWNLNSSFVRGGKAWVGVYSWPVRGRKGQVEIKRGRATKGVGEAGVAGAMRPSLAAVMSGTNKERRAGGCGLRPSSFEAQATHSEQREYTSYSVQHKKGSGLGRMQPRRGAF
jgi:hypothetical protein